MKKFLNKIIDQVKWFLFEKKRQNHYEPLDPIVK